MRILIILALIVVLYYVVKGLFQPRRSDEDTSSGHPDMGQQKETELVKDPYCQTYVPVSSALQAKVGEENLFFCSKDCMNRYIQERG
jgi:hypothetical protein